MKIKMKTTACGPDGNMHPGRTYDLPKSSAEAIVSGGFAVEASDALASLPEKAADPKVDPSAPRSR